MRHLDLENLAARYDSGETFESLGKSVGLSGSQVRIRLAKVGVVPRTSSHYIRLAVDTSDLVFRYLGGESELALSRSMGISRPVVRRRLLESGIQPRNRSQGAFVRMSKMSPEERKSLAENAHAAVRGITQSNEQRVKSANAREVNRAIASDHERILAEWIAARGVNVVPQKAIDRYNIDIALPESSIAVEVFGGNWHASGRHAARYRPRIDHLRDRGWHTIVVWVTWQGLHEAVADKIVAVHEARRRGEPMRRQEHVMRGDGYVATVDQVNPNNGAIVLGRDSGNH